MKCHTNNGGDWGGGPINISAKWKEMRKIIAVCSHYYLFAFGFCLFHFGYLQHNACRYDVCLREKEETEDSAPDPK